MKLRDDDILQVWDVVHYSSGETFTVNGYAGTIVSKFLVGRHTVKKITRKAPRVSRKEYKRRAIQAEARIKMALEIVESSCFDVPKFYKILRGDE